MKIYPVIYVSCMAKKELKTPEKLSCYAYEKCYKPAKSVYIFIYTFPGQNLVFKWSGEGNSR